MDIENKTTSSQFDDGTMDTSIQHFVKMVLRKDLSWATFASILNDMTSTLDKSKEVIGILIHILQSKLETDKTESENQVINVEKTNVQIGERDQSKPEVIQIEDEDEDNTKVNPKTESDEIEMIDFEDGDELPNSGIQNCFNERSNANNCTPLSFQINGEDCSIEFEESNKISDSMKNTESELKTNVCQLSDDDKSNPTNSDEICETTSATDNQLEEITQTKLHKKNNSTKKLVKQCKVCGKKFKKLRNLKVHKRIHRKEKIFHCSKCDTTFRKIALLNKHEESHGKKEDSIQFSCETCDQNFKNFAGQEFHAKNYPDHSIKQNPEIKSSFNIQTEEYSNMTDDLHDQDLNNSVQVFETNSQIGNMENDHLEKVNMVEESSVKRFTEGNGKDCNVQDEESNIASDPLNITKDHQTEDQNNFTLEKSKEHPSLSIDEIQLRDESEDTIQISLEKQTEKIITDTEGKKYRCNFCKKCFQTRQITKRHEISKHTGDKKFKCKFCEKLFVEKTNLKTHEIIHTSDKPFQCWTCLKTFNNMGNLKRHRPIHSSKKPFQCQKQTCNKCFKDLEQLKKHEKIHSDERRPFHCKFCSRSYTQRYLLEHHENAHRDEKPYQCKTCEKCFYSPHYLKRHEKNHCQIKKTQKS